MTDLSLLILALGAAAGLAWLAYRQWGARGAIAVAIGTVTALAAFWPRRRAPVAPPPGVKLEPIRKAAAVMITRREDKAREAIREADADELARRMRAQE